jgi:DtxR family transcriptional regulator, Mn-dependent transcriptional regulator
VETAHNLEDELKNFPAAAEYLSSIFIIQRDYDHVTNTRLADWMGVSASAVTQALGRLKRLGLATQERYEDIKLSDHGRDLAVTVLRRHYLIEHLLVRVLKYPWDKSDEEAKVLQTQISHDLAEHLFDFLGKPQTCPHGNPLPGAPIERKLLEAPRLSQIALGLRIVILRITEEGEGRPNLLHFCDATGLRPGVRFEVIGRDDKGIRLKNAQLFPGEHYPEEFEVPLEIALYVRYEVV